jgi:hypothetical protein
MRGIRDAVVVDGREDQTDLDAPLDCSRSTDGRNAIFEPGSSEYHGVVGLRPCLSREETSANSGVGSHLTESPSRTIGDDSCRVVEPSQATA